MNDPQGTDAVTERDGGATLTDEEIETRALDTGARGASLSRADDTGDTGDDSGDSGDSADTADTGDDSGDSADTGDDSGDSGTA